MRLCFRAAYVFILLNHCTITITITLTKVSDAITTNKVVRLEMMCVNQTRQAGVNDPRCAEDKKQLKLQKNYERRISDILTGHCIIFIKLVWGAYLSSLYSAVGIVLANVCEKYWVPKLRTLAERVIGVIGVNFATAVKYRLRQREATEYVALSSCNSTPSVFLPSLSSLETKEFIWSLKGFNTRGEGPTAIYLDNGSTLIAASRWLKCIRKDEELHNFLCLYSVAEGSFCRSWTRNWGNHNRSLVSNQYKTSTIHSKLEIHAWNNLSKFQAQQITFWVSQSWCKLIL